ncbi:hypothetical protein GQ473_04745 [archaeon]|nr:hypothetical protein [archaeon]
MTSIEEHKIIIKEFEDDINEKLRRNIINERQKLIGFATSEGSTNYFALFLHKQNLISHGFNVNHKWFASKKRAEEKFPFDFPSKKELFTNLIRQEQLRNILCYGKNKSIEDVEESIKTFFEIKTIIEKLIGESI